MWKTYLHVHSKPGTAKGNVGVVTWLAMAGVLAAISLALFGLPHIPLPMPTWQYGIVTPTCGLTRATEALAGGNLIAAWNYNPAAYLLAVTAATVLTDSPSDSPQRTGSTSTYDCR